MSAIATCSLVPSWRQITAKGETLHDQRTKTIQSPTRNWTRSRESPERQTRGSTWGSRRVVVAGERTREQRMQARSARLEKLKGVCGWEDRCGVPEEDRKKLHFEMKCNTNHFETWLVEMVHPNGTGMPDCIKPMAAVSPNHPKYQMPVNHFIVLADALVRSEKQAHIPSSMLSVLDKVIDERALYSHLMAHPQIRSVDDVRNNEYEKHQYFIDVMEDVRTILGRRSAEKPQVEALQPTPAVRPTDATIQRHTSTLGKRKPSVTKLDGTEQRKVVKKASTSNKPTISTTEVVVGGLNKTCAAAAKPMSWASIASTGIAA